MQFLKQLLTLQSQQEVGITEEVKFNAIFSSAIKASHLIAEEEPGRIRFSNRSPISMIRYDYFQGVRRGEFRLTSGPEGKGTVHFNLEITPIAWVIGFTTIVLMITWSIPFDMTPGPLVVEEIFLLIAGLISFFVWREYIRYNMKLFIKRTSERATKLAYKRI